jgi:hypothetical protein
LKLHVDLSTDRSRFRQAARAHRQQLGVRLPVRQALPKHQLARRQRQRLNTSWTEEVNVYKLGNDVYRHCDARSLEHILHDC